jgi:prophage antirepressor-like protein
MSNLNTFDFNTQTISVITIDDTPWFVAKEVAAVLEYSNPAKLLEHVDEEDKQTINPNGMDSPILGQTFGSNTFRLSIINESGLYSAVLGSHKPQAKAFKRWVTSEVLPAIRKTGSYTQQPLSPGELLRLQAEAIIAVEQRQQEQARALLEQDTRLKVIEGRFDRVDKEILALPAAMEEVPEKSIRSSLNELLRSYAYRTGESYQKLWGDLYREYRYRHHVDLVTRAKNQRKSALSYAEEVGVIDKLYSLAVLLYGEETITAPVATTPDQYGSQS